MEPTVFANVTPECGSPARRSSARSCAILKYVDADGSVDKAVALVNNTESGLGGLVFGQDAAAALNVGRPDGHGSMGINFRVDHAAPFAGRHDSGLRTSTGSKA